MSQYEDTDLVQADPNINSRRYKLSSIDACGNESAISPYHNTILMQNNDSNFNWNSYLIEGQATPVSQYLLMRDSVSSGDWRKINQTSGTQNAMIAPGYSLWPNARYRIDTNLGGLTCTPTARVQTGINVTRSNIKNRSVSVPQLIGDAAKITLQPNPAKDEVQITTAIELQTINVYDNLGRLVITYKIENSKSSSSSINTSGLASGIYTVHCKGKNVEVRKKLLVE